MLIFGTGLVKGDHKCLPQTYAISHRTRRHPSCVCLLLSTNFFSSMQVRTGNSEHSICMASNVEVTGADMAHRMQCKGSSAGYASLPCVSFNGETCALFLCKKTSKCWQCLLILSQHMRITEMEWTAGMGVAGPTRCVFSRHTPHQS